MSTPQPQTSQQPTGGVIEALQTLIRERPGLTNEHVAGFLANNVANLVAQGKITQEQANQIKAHILNPKNQGQQSGVRSSSALESMLVTDPGQQAGYPVSATLTSTNPGAVPWTPARPSLTGGYASGRMSGTPAQITKGTDDAVLQFDDARPRKRNTPGDQSMRKSIQDLVASVDPNVRIEPEVEDLLLSIADEFIDSVANFACRLAKHRGGDTLEVRDLQLHLERNHNIRIPGFSSDGDVRISLSQTTAAPSATAQASNRRAGTGTHMTLRSQRLAQVQAAKREGKTI